MAVGTILRTWKGMLGIWRFRRRITRALALQRRGEVRSDGLPLINASICLSVQWRARLIHPWDRHLPQQVVGRLFVEQCLEDTDAALWRLFSTLPEIDRIELSVVDPESNQKIMTGMVSRKDLADARCFASVKMRLREAGVDFRLADSTLHRLDTMLQYGPR